MQKEIRDVIASTRFPLNAHFEIMEFVVNVE